MDSSTLEHDLFDPTEQLDKLWSAAEAFDWKAKYGRSARSTYIVYLAAQRIARRVGSLKVSLSVRDLHLESGYSLDTVRRALERLRGVWLHVVSKGGPTREGVALATTYTLNVKLPDEVAASSFPEQAEPSHEAFAGRALAWRIYSYVQQCEEPVSVADLAQAVECVRSSVYNNLKLLVPAGLLTQDEDGRIRLGSADPNELAEQRGTTGRTQQRRERVKLDREGYRAFQERRSLRFRIDPETGEVLSPEEAYARRVYGVSAAALRDLPDEVEAFVEGHLRRKQELERTVTEARKKHLRDRIELFNKYGTDLLAMSGKERDAA